MRAEVWLVNLDPTVGREQAGTRPAVIVSDDAFNRSFAELVVILPITSVDKKIRSHVAITSPEANLKLPSFVKCEDVSSISKQRLIKKIGKLDERTMSEIEEKLKLILAF